MDTATTPGTAPNYEVWAPQWLFSGEMANVADGGAIAITYRDVLEI